jgi:orotidine-5'-phosphate decarboxylase
MTGANDMNFNEKLNSVILKKKHYLCIGLDPDPGKMPVHLNREANPFLIFIKEVVNATKDLVIAYKANEAFFQSAGSDGYSALECIKTNIPEDVFFILDGKKGDIGNTASKYAGAAYDQYKADAVTVNPYMGYDAVKPFISRPEKGAFILTLTSNPSAADFQYLRSSNQPVYMHVANKVNEWNQNNNCGLVVGATKPDELAEIRKLTPGLPFLVPGVGAQGGDLNRVLINGCDINKTGILINVGRDIIYCDNSFKFANKVRERALFYISEMQKNW